MVVQSHHGNQPSAGASAGTGASASTMSCHPLSWGEARSRLRRFLDGHINDPLSTSTILRRGGQHDEIQNGVVDHTDNADIAEGDGKDRYAGEVLRKILQWDLDVYIGGVASSFSLLILAIVGIVNSGGDGESSISKYSKSQLWASTLLLVGSLFNLWCISRRRWATSQGSDSLKKREIAHFLKYIEKEVDQCQYDDDDDNNSKYGIDDNHNNHNHNNKNEHDRDQEEQTNHKTYLTGTSLTDVYPVYRIHQSKDGKSTGGSWSRVPTLLLVEGDCIALQVGDISPAACRPVDGGKSTPTRIDAGERITMNILGEKTSSVTTKLPRGRTTLNEQSHNFLSLCNRMKVFELLETPLENFLQEPRVESRKPVIWRQIEHIRGVLTILGAGVVVSIVIILSIRGNFSSSDTGRLFVTAPFLASLGIFPYIGPTCLIFIEIMGTARILSAYHPVASLPNESSSDGVTNIDTLLFHYFLATISNRFSLQEIKRRLQSVARVIYRIFKGSDVASRNLVLVTVPPTSLNLLEKLGVATAFTLVDDELVCEPQSIPQQLLIPSAHGLKLLDICPTYEDDSEDGSESDTEYKRMNKRSFDGEFHDSDSDSDVDMEHQNQLSGRRIRRRRFLRKRQRSNMSTIQSKASGESNAESSSPNSVTHEVQFEDPLWYKHLNTLKCIGLACLLVDQGRDDVGRDKNKKSSTAFRGGVAAGTTASLQRESTEFSVPQSTATEMNACKSALVRMICSERRSMQLQSLAQCIGFSTKSTGNQRRGDIDQFMEKLRLHVVSTARLRERLEIDSHERGSEESRWWGLLRPDSTSVIVQDGRSGAYQLVTVGDPRLVTRMCHEAWQGENATISPLSGQDRMMILETSNSWRLADLDVKAFSYSPIPYNFGATIDPKNQTDSSTFYLLDNDSRGDSVLIQKDKHAAGEWPLLHNQIFLGVLGSLVIPRQETQGLLSTLQDAGVRFVYFSPRNMRLTKEIASQMGIDVAWNCAISLRPLDHGEEDPHRMVSTYADWDVNAKLPHGIESVRRHLQEVDNVPLLVSLFTDVTKQTTTQMIETFQEYNDTVITVGLSHLHWNSNIFSTADLAVGVDELSDFVHRPTQEVPNFNSLLPAEILFVSAISTHTCAFRLRGVSSIEYMPTILAQGRASLQAATSAAIFLMCGGMSFSFYVLFCTFSASSTMPFVSATGGVMFLQVILPLIGLPITMSDADNDVMKRVPPKNDTSITFGKKEGRMLYLTALLKALPPAIFPQLLYTIAFGELMIGTEQQIVESTCFSTFEPGDWTRIVRCKGLHDYVGGARFAAASLSMVEFWLCIIVSSSSFINRTLSIFAEPPWRRNTLWVCSVFVALAISVLFLSQNVDRDCLSVLPWYYYLLGIAMPFLCLAWNEVWKRLERQIHSRAEKLRRLQFETRLGMWSPK